MSNSGLSPQAQTLLRRMVIGLGVLILIATLGIEWLGFSSPGIGTAQWVGIAFGVLIIIMGILGSRFGSLYQKFTVLLVNTIIILLVLEVGSMLILNRVSRIGAVTLDEKLLELEYYQNQDWYQRYLQEASQISTSYYPYLIWRQNPYSGTIFNVDEHRNRLTVGAECGDNAFEIFMFGGSTLWGAGSPDQFTIPSYLQAQLNEADIEQQVCITNFGSSGYVSNQEMIMLLLQLESGRIPDVVIFYNGANDVINGFRYQQPVIHWSYDDFENRFYGQSDSAAALIDRSALVRLVKYIMAQTAEDTPDNSIAESIPSSINLGVSDGTLDSQITATYLNSINNMQALADFHEFDIYFFWQPLLGTGDKTLVDWEQELYDALLPDYLDLSRAIYETIAQESQIRDELFYLGDVFDTEATGIFYDRVHVTPEGNRIIVERMWSLIGESLITAANSDN